MSSTPKFPFAPALRWTDESLPLATRRKLLAEDVKRVRARKEQASGPSGATLQPETQPARDHERAE